MSILKNLFGGNVTQKGGANFWNHIEKEEDITAAQEKSFEKTVVIFKHSTRCFISKTVLKNFENEVEHTSKDAEYYFLDLIHYRDLSNKIAEKFGVKHESPQLLVLKDGKVIKDASHQAIFTSLF